MDHEQVKRLMHEWDRCGMLPESLVTALSDLFESPPPDPVRMHIAAFGWWCRQSPDRGASVRLHVLLARLNISPDGREWLRRVIDETGTV